MPETKKKKMPEAGRRALVVLGMHRSGTSAVTRVLSLCGASLPKSLMAPKPDNPAGFWESERLYALNDEILHSAGSRWDDIGSFPSSWFESDLMPGYRDRLALLLTEEFGDASLMVIKDPRVCRLVPLFDATLTDLGASAHYIIPLRSPLEIAGSLRARDGFSTARGILLWLRHILEAEFATRGLSRVFISYDTLLTDWPTVVDRIASAFALEWPALDASTKKEISGFLKPDLKHQRAAETSLEARDDIADQVSRVFSELTRAAAGETLNEIVLDEARQWLQDAARLFVPVVKETERSLASERSEVARLRNEEASLHAEQERLVARNRELEQDVTDVKAEHEASRRWVAELEENLSTLKDEQSASKRWADDLQRELDAKQKERQQAEAKRRELDEQIEALRQEQQKSRQWAAELQQEIDKQQTERRRLEDHLKETDHGRRLAEEQAELLRQNIRTHERVAAELKAHLATQQEAAAKLERRIEEFRQLNASLSHDLEAQRQESDKHLQEVSAYAESLKQQLAALQDEIARSGAELADQRAELAEQKEVFSQTEGYALSLAQQLDAQREAREQAEAALNAIRQSTSWRISAPVRGVGHAIHFVVWLIKRTLFLVARTIFRLTPMPERTRWAIRQRLHGVPSTRSEQQPPTPSPAATADTPPADPKAAHRERAREALDAFLASGQTLDFPTVDSPRISVILILYNQAELTFACLRALQAMNRNDVEIVIWDNASSDDTATLLSRVNGVQTHLYGENLHFLRGCNEAVKHSSGEYLLFLNNDAEMMPGALDAALNVFEEEAGVGAVGGKVILLDGMLQEAGNMIWADGSCLGYGRGDDPDAPMYAFRRDVDYVSGVFLLTPRELFIKDGGFTDAFAPAYYEETDYCMRLWEQGYRVVYEPEARITHFEYGSSSGESATDLMVRNQQIFRERHGKALEARHFMPDVAHILKARTHRSDAPRVLYIDDKFPHLDIGQGFPRSNFILRALTDRGAEVTLFATNQAMESNELRYRDISTRVECFCGSRHEDLPHLLTERTGHYDYIFVSRPANMEALQYAFEGAPQLRNDTTVIYDAEALFCSRDIAWHELQGKPLPDQRKNKLIRSEVGLSDIADVIVTVSEAEKAHFTEHVSADVSVIGHAMAARPGKATFDERQDFVFIGAIPNDDNPNADSMRWFIGEVWPLIRTQLSSVKPRLRVVGLNESPSIQALAAEDVVIEGRVEDLAGVYDAARVVVIPTRYAAGIPYKGHEAAQFGVPMVTTALIAEQLQWEHGRELLSAPHTDPKAFAAHCAELYEDAALWQRVQQSALDALERDCSPAGQIAAIEHLFGMASAKQTASAAS